MTVKASWMEPFLQRFTEWAKVAPDVRAAVLVGSAARSDHPADDWADLDILTFVDSPQRYVTETEWLGSLGSVWVSYPARRGAVHVERFVVFEDAASVDFAFFPARKAAGLVWVLRAVHRFPALRRLLPPRTAAEVNRAVALASDAFHRGMRPLVDKDGFVRHFPALFREPPSLPKPTQAEFQDLVSSFWYQAVRWVKKLRRGEVYLAMVGCDVHMKQLMLQMMEWQARATNGWDYETWFRGRFLEEWADPRALAALRSAYALYDSEEVRRALLVTIETFRWLAADTGQRLGYPLAESGSKRVAEWVKVCLADLQPSA